MYLKSNSLWTVMFAVAALLHAQQQAIGGDDAPRLVKPPVVVRNSNPAAPLAAVLTFEASKKVTTVVTIKDGKQRRELSFDDSHKPENGLPLIGFRPDRKHELVITITDSDGQMTVSKPLTFQSSKLPSDPARFPRIQTKTLVSEALEPGFRLLNPRRRIPRDTQAGNNAERKFGESFGMLLMVDHEGTPVWYYQTDSRIAGFSYRENGRILFVTADFRLVEIDMLGNVTRSWFAAERPQGKLDDPVAVPALTFHHDADVLPSGNLLALSTKRRKINDYFTSEYDADAARQSQWVMGDRIIEFTPEGKLVWEWNAFEHLPVRRIGYETFSNYWIRRGFAETIDWSHANSITKLDDGSVMVNFRYQSAIVNFDPKSGEINWIFGEPSGWPKQLESKLIRLEGDARWPWHQHAPLFTSRGTLLLFDNGNYQARPFDKPTPVAETRSRAVEYEVDLNTMTARQVWTSETADDDPVVSMAMGSATELPETGNVLVGYGAILDPERISEITWQNRAGFDQITRCVEYTRTDPTEVVWELSLQPTGSDPKIGWSIFNCQIVRTKSRD